ncbi:hypothetical protein Z967_08110 [Clostridium novyi A str. 4540]|uniref:hypothetical protein n=1 Tax=Clostridium novyi TaxID=1542 RepID=UPI0004D43D8B|nr:hypothetical protein [Clostridium novyi]KEH89543.1 hypothetical protein Z967_08110 [Clostridium novyi A str. 4540]
MELGNVISYVKHISIKGDVKTDKDIENNDNNVKAQAKVLLQELNNKYSNGKPSDAEWAKFVREFMPKIDNLDNKTEKFILKVTLGDIKQLLFEYRKDLEGRGDKARIRSLKSEINKNLN